MKKELTYVSYAFTMNARKYIKDFTIHDNQILVALEACKTCLFQEKRTSKGVIYQVDFIIARTAENFVLGMIIYK